MGEKKSVEEVKLDIVIRKLEGIEETLYGNGSKEGMRIDVDRLKRSRATHNAVLWVIFTALVGIAGKVIADIIQIGG